MAFGLRDRNNFEFFNHELWNAAINNDLDKAESLIDQGVNVDSRAEIFYYITPLQAAASHGNTSMVAYFLSRGADVNATDGYFKTALIHAASSGSYDIVRLLIEGKENNTINSHDGWSSTAFHHAARAGSPKILDYLLRHGADPQKINGAKRKAIDEALLFMKKEKDELRVYEFQKCIEILKPITEYSLGVQ